MGGSLNVATWQQDVASIRRNPNFLNFLDQEFEGRVLAKGAECDGRPLLGSEIPRPHLLRFRFMAYPCISYRKEF